MPVRLTETAINGATREVAERTRRDLTDAACPGLRLRLTPAGAAGWVLACRDRLGRIRRFPLGTFPDMGISEALAPVTARQPRNIRNRGPVAKVGLKAQLWCRDCTGPGAGGTIQLP
jgi:hypothetical protein